MSPFYAHYLYLVLYLVQSNLPHCCCWRGHKNSMMEFIGSQVEKAEEITWKDSPKVLKSPIKMKVCNLVRVIH